jgi:hypothetical protein
MSLFWQALFYIIIGKDILPAMLMHPQIMLTLKTQKIEILFQDNGIKLEKWYL